MNVYQMPSFIIQEHINKDITQEKISRFGLFWPFTSSNHVFSGNKTSPKNVSSLADFIRSSIADFAVASQPV
jgi:hypothetical protein